MSAASAATTVLRQSVLYTLATAASKGAALVVLLVLTRALSPEQYGVWGVMGAVGNLLWLLFLFGLFGPATRIYFDEPDREARRRLYGTLFVFQSGAGLVVALVLAVLAGQVSLTGSFVSGPYLRVAIAAAFLSSFNLLPMALMRARGQAGRHAALSTGSTLVLAAAGLVVIVPQFRTAYAVLVATLVAQGALAVVYLVLLRPDITLCFDRRRLFPILAWALHFLPASFANWTLSMSDRLVLERLVPLGHVGVYSVGYLMAATLMIAADSAGISWYTFFLRAEYQSRDRDTVIGYATYFVAAFAFLGLGIVLFGPVVVRRALPASYAAAAPVVVWAGLGFLGYAPSVVFSYAAMSVRRVTILPALTLGAGALNIVLNLVWVPRFGITAAAVSSLTAYSAQALGLAWLASRIYPIAHQYRRWLIAVGTSFVLGVASTFIPQGPLVAELAWRSTVLIVAWPAVLWVSGFFSAVELQAIRTRWARCRGSPLN
jgi:O-antigen/teichoic acid export membrane protein